MADAAPDAAMDATAAPDAAVDAATPPPAGEGMLRDVAAPMRQGDLVILYLGHDNVDHLYLTPDNFSIYNSKFGDFHHVDFVGKPFGSRVYARSGGGRGGGDDKKGWIVALAPTPELWAMALPHRTQIVQPLDAAVVCAHLDLRDGKVVLESGTGSGAMTSCLARCVAPTGRVLSFEFNGTRAAKAAVEFPRNGLPASLVTCEHRDVCADGFGAAADAVFLDLPEPWLAVGHAARACRPGGRLASYSPCVEQVARPRGAPRIGCDAEDRRGPTEGSTCGRTRRSLEPRAPDGEPDAKRRRAEADAPLPGFLAPPGHARHTA
ncbi:tRNA methyltransferase [Aureococcus anophagefferens]|nr:tRNA methyltransferase [Aureococcus anophagefferens]